VDVRVNAPDSIDAFIHCYDERHVMVFSSGSFFDRACDYGPLTVGTHRFTCEVPGFLLNDGTYTLDVMLIRGRSDVFVSEPSVLRFRVEDDFPPIEGWQWRPVGVVRPDLRWRHQSLASTGRLGVPDGRSGVGR
jgi:lipopolysaccharide transport system ATP-binding protein